MKYKITFSLFFLLIFNLFYSQTVIKGNVLTTLFSVPQIGFETQIGSKTTFQFDALGTYWKSFNGAPQQFLILIPEFRYYPKAAFSGFFIGAHLGGNTFKIQKWNYLNTDLYQQGVGYSLGGTIGYQFNLNERFNAEVFAGGGTVQSFYKGYSLSTGIRYDVADKYNKSGEILPYRFGAMLVYKLK